MTTPTDTSGLALIQSEVRHQNSALERIERKLDKVTDDHEVRLRQLETGKTNSDSELAHLKGEGQTITERIEALEQSDRKWAALAAALAVIVPTLFKIVWP